MRPSAEEPSAPADPTEKDVYQFRLIHVLYAMALIAAGLAALGWTGGVFALGVLAIWIKVFFLRHWVVPVAELLLVAIVVLVLAALLLPALNQARESARRATAQNNLKQIMLALHTYHGVHGSFPPAVVRGPDGKPWHSWRVLILSHLDEGQGIYDKYRFDEPWDGPSNRLLADSMPSEFASPFTDDVARKTTSFLAIVGPRTMWPGERSVRLKEITDSPAVTLSVVEHRGTGIHWMEPRDIAAEDFIAILSATDPSRVPPGSGSETSDYFFAHTYSRIVGVADGSVRSLGYHHDPAVARSLCTIDDGQPPSQDEIPLGTSLRVPHWGNWYRLSLFLLLAILPTPWAWRTYFPGE